MNSKKIVLLISVAICLMAAPIAMAAGHNHSSASFSAPRASFSASRPSIARQARPQFSQQSSAVAHNWHGSGNNWHHGHHHHRFHNFFFADFGFPYYGYGWGYPYYGYGYDPYYDGGYYSYDNRARVYEGLDVSVVVQVQRRLARAGYYRGRIDGVIGGGTRSAIREYERSHRLPVDGVIDDDLLATMGLS